MYPCHWPGSVTALYGPRYHLAYHSQEFPNLDFIVQDVSKDMLARSQQLRTDDLQGRVTFMQHDFFDPQPIYSASAYFIRQCIHNWNDSDCVRIFRAFVPALEHCKPRTPLLINDTILPDLNTKSKIEEHDLRQLDMGMLVVLGAKQRTKKQFEKILKLADDRFEVSHGQPLCTIGIVADQDVVNG